MATASASLEEDKRLHRFFASDKTPRKRLRSALDYVRNHCTEEQEHDFFTKCYSTVYAVIAGTLKQYEKLIQNDLRVEETTGFMSKLRKKHVGVEDWQDVFELFRRLLRHCADLMNKGYQRNGITETLMKFTHPGNDHKIRSGAFQLLLQYCDILQQLAGPHMELLASCIDYPIIQSSDPILSTRNMVSWSLPQIWMEEPIDVLKSDSMPEAAEAVEILDMILKHALAGLVSDVPVSSSSPTIQRSMPPSLRIEHFAFWMEILFRYFFPVFFPLVHKDTSLSAAAGQMMDDTLENDVSIVSVNASGTSGFMSSFSAPCWSSAEGFEVCPLIIQLSLERWLDAALSDPAFGNELWKSPERAKMIEEMLRQRFEHKDPEGQRLMMRCIAFYHRIITGEQLSRPSYISSNFEYYVELFVAHATRVFTVDAGSIPAQIQVDLILSALSLFSVIMSQNLTLSSSQKLRNQMLSIVDDSYAKFTSEALSQTCLDYLKCLFQCFLSSPDRLDTKILALLIERIKPWIVPLDYEKNLIGRHFIGTWEMHLINLLKGVLRFIDQSGTPDTSDQQLTDDLSPQYDPASRWEVSNGDWLKLSTLHDCLLLWDRVLHLLPPSILDQLDLSLHGLAVKAITNMARLVVHDAAVPLKHYVRLELFVTDYEQRANMKKDIKRRWKEEDKERTSLLAALSPGCIFSLLSPWFLPVCGQPKIGYEESRASAFEALCTILCTRTQSHLPEHLEAQALASIAAGLSNGGSQTVASIVRHSRKLFALDIPGTTLLMKLYLKACRRILLEDVAGEILRRTLSIARSTADVQTTDGSGPALSSLSVRVTALEILRCMFCYANRYPQAKVLPVEFSSTEEVSMLDVKQEAGKILQEFISLPGTEIPLKKTAINIMFLMLLDELYASHCEKLLVAEWLHKLTEYCNDVCLEVGAVSMECLKELSGFHEPLLTHYKEELYHVMLALCAVAWQQLVTLVQYSMDYPSSLPSKRDRQSKISKITEIEQAGQRVVYVLDCQCRWIMCCPSLLEQQAVSQHFFEVLEASLIGKIPSLHAEGVANTAATPRMFRDLLGMRQKHNRTFQLDVFEKPGVKAEVVLFHLLNHFRHFPILEGCEVMDSISATEFYGLGNGEIYGEIQNDEIDPGSAVHFVYHDSVLISLVGRTDGTAAFVVRDYVGTHAYKALPINPERQTIDTNFLLYLLHRRIDNKAFRLSMISSDTKGTVKADEFDLRVNPVNIARLRTSLPASAPGLREESFQPTLESVLDFGLLDDARLEGSYSTSSTHGEQPGDLTDIMNLHTAPLVSSSSSEVALGAKRDDSVLVLKSTDYEDMLQAIQQDSPASEGRNRAISLGDFADNTAPYRKALHPTGIRAVDLQLDPLRNLLFQLPLAEFSDPTLLGNMWTLARYEQAQAKTKVDADFHSEADRLGVFLNDVEVFNEFRQFLRSEFAVESVDFCKRVDIFTHTVWYGVEHGQRRMHECALEIFERHVKPGAPEEVHVAATSISAIQSAIQQFQVTINVFDEAYREVASMLVQDKLGRFVSNNRTRRIEIFSQCEEIARIANVLCAMEAQHHAKLSKEANPCHPGPSAMSISVVDPIRSFATQLCMIPAEDVKKYKLLLTSDDAKGKATLRNLKHLDTMPVRELVKCAVLYVHEGQVRQNEILSNTCGSADYEDFVKALGWQVDVHKHRGFAGKVDTNRCTNGKFFPYYANDELEVFFHVATMMPNEEGDPQQVSKKRHIGNDMVHIVWSDHDREYLPLTITSDFGDVIIVVYPLKRAHRGGLYRIQVISKIGLAIFGPLTDGMVVSKALLAPLVRSTAINGNRTVREHQAAMSGIYEKPYPTRRRVISEIVQSYATPLTHLHLMSLLFRTPSCS